ncbi:MAG: type IX secretion system outer membrane channel protein PorV [Candidatus Azobacteroides sp.]|nr:type IX secretion system outer membrane channel protein PorV [Candidatus Azobacteroides sp.]
MRKSFAVSLFFLVCPFIAFSQDIKNQFRPIVTGAPSLTIAPDARGGGMGDLGVATTPDINSQYWNPAKYAFMYDKAGVSLSYTPWLRKLVNDINLAYLAGFWKLGSDDQHAMSASLRYFSLGEVIVTQGQDDQGYSISPYEMAIDLGYSIKLSETFAGGVALRYIHSDMSWSEDENNSSAWAIAADVAGYYNNYVMIGSNESLFSFGFNISNIGSKLSYDSGNTSSFLPTNMGLGFSLLYPVSDFNTFSVSLDLNKLLVPTPPGYSDMTDEEKVEAALEYQNMSPIKGIFKSFTDAPGGFKEELEEIMWSLGVEYSYMDQFFLRGGYFHESENKGNRKYFSLGAGFKMNVFQLDAAYLISTAQSNPLDQTLRFSLSFNMDGIRELMGR